MKVLVIGSEGSMGRRYCAILNYLGIDVLKMDMDNTHMVGLYKAADKVIIATPTVTHVAYARVINKPLLIEKPVSKLDVQIEDLIKSGAQAHMVSNWRYTIENGAWDTGKCSVYLDYYNHGKDEHVWDAIQLIMLDSKARLATESPLFKCSINGLMIGLGQIELSYIRMIKDWLGDCKYLWTMQDALEGNQKVRDYGKNRNSV